MTIRSILLVAALGLSAPAVAQTTAPATTAPATTASRFGSLSSLLGGAVPSVASSSAGNVAGLLGYCVQNNILGGATASSVLGQLAGKTGVTSTPGYAAGQTGTLQTGQSALSLANLKGQVKTQVCNLVLNRAKSFLGTRAATTAAPR